MQLLLFPPYSAGIFETPYPIKLQCCSLGKVLVCFGYCSTSRYQCLFDQLQRERGQTQVTFCIAFINPF